MGDGRWRQTSVPSYSPQGTTYSWCGRHLRTVSASLVSEQGSFGSGKLVNVTQGLSRPRNVPVLKTAPDGEIQGIVSKSEKEWVGTAPTQAWAWPTISRACLLIASTHSASLDSNFQHQKRPGVQWQVGGCRAAQRPLLLGLRLLPPLVTGPPPQLAHKAAGALCVLDSCHRYFQWRQDPLLPPSHFHPMGWGNHGTPWGGDQRQSTWGWAPSQRLTPSRQCRFLRVARRPWRLELWDAAQETGHRCVLFLSHKTLSFLPRIPEPQEKPGAEMRRRMTLEMESSLLPPSFLPLEASSLTQHPN